MTSFIDLNNQEMPTLLIAQANDDLIESKQPYDIILKK